MTNRELRTEEQQQAILEHIGKKKAMGKKLTFAERNILNIFNRRNRPKEMTATLSIKVSKEPVRGIIQNIKTGLFKGWRGETIRAHEWRFFNIQLDYDGGSTKILPTGIIMDIITRKLKDGSKVKIKI